eukprot:scaffold1504_cov417-Prasinococcus_capsulatus_cf.AAC.3
MDHDELSADDFMGRALLPIMGLVEDRPCHLTLKLTNTKGAYDKDRGELLIKYILEKSQQTNQEKLLAITIVRGKNLLALEKQHKYRDALARKLGRLNRHIRKETSRMMSNWATKNKAWGQKFKDAMVVHGEMDEYGPLPLCILSALYLACGTARSGFY